jgi:hypothetical protein
MSLNHVAEPGETSRMSTLIAQPVAPNAFTRLRETAELIARHPDYPGKPAVEAAVLGEIDELHRVGRLDDHERLSLRSLLAGH